LSSSSSSSFHSTVLIAIVPAYALDAPVVWRAAPFVDRSKPISATLIAPILPLPTFHRRQAPPQLEASGNEIKSGRGGGSKRKRSGGLLTHEAAVVEGKEKDEAKQQKRDGIAARAAAREEKKAAKAIAAVAVARAKRVTLEQRASAKMLKSVERIGRLASIKPSVRGTKTKTARQINDARAARLDAARLEFRLNSAALNELRSLHRDQDPAVAADAVAMAAAMPEDDAELARAVDGRGGGGGGGGREDEDESKEEKRNDDDEKRRGAEPPRRKQRRIIIDDDEEEEEEEETTSSSDSGDDDDDDDDDDEEEHSHRPQRPRGVISSSGGGTR
jgi:hypothetical protein